MTNLMEQAKQGDPKAIAALMNKSTEPKGITVKATREGNCLQVLFEGQTVPGRDATVDFVQKGMANLQINSIAIVRLYGRQVGQEKPVWQEEVVLNAHLKPTANFSHGYGTPSVNEELAGDDLLPDDLIGHNQPGSLDEGAYFDENDYGEHDYDENDEYDDDYPPLDDDYDNTPSDVPHLPNESITDFIDDEDGAMYDEDHDDLDQTVTADSAKPKQKSNPALLGLLLFLALGLTGYYLYSQQRSLLASLPVVGSLIGTGETVPPVTPPAAPPTGQAPAAPANSAPTAATPAPNSAAAPAATAAPNAAATPAATPAAAPAAPAATPAAAPAATAAPNPAATPAANPAPSANDPFRLAVQAATAAAEKTQTAATPEDWAAIATLWETAITNMKAVPADHPQYKVAQERAQSYPANLQYAQQKAGQ